MSANQVCYESVRRDLDLYMVWKLRPKTQLRLVACNLLGKDYINESSYNRSWQRHPAQPYDLFELADAACDTGGEVLNVFLSTCT